MEGQGDYGYDSLPVMHIAMRCTCPFAGCGDYSGYSFRNHIREAHRAAGGAVLLVQEATVTLRRTTLLRVPLHPPVFLQLSGRDDGDIALQSVGARPMADGRTLWFTVVIPGPGPGPGELTVSSAVPCTPGRIHLVPVTRRSWSSSGSLSFTIVVHVHQETEPPADEAIEALSVK